MSLFIAVYVAAIALAALTIGWAAFLAKKNGQRIHQVFFYFVTVNNLVGLFEIMFRFYPARIGVSPGRFVGAISGFVVFPLMAAFSYLTLDFFMTLTGRPFPKALKRAFAGYWGLLFLGFLAAQIRLIGSGDQRLERFLMPFFDVAIMLSGLGGALFGYLRGRAIADSGERRFVVRISIFFFAAFLVFGILFYAPLSIVRGWRALIESIVGLAYLLPPLFWLNRRANETRNAPLTRLAGGFEILDGWLEAKGLSPRERQIARCVLEGKSNKAIEQELFISGRTVESHLYSVYRKLGVKNRLQLARLAASEAGNREEGTR